VSALLLQAGRDKHVLALQLQESVPADSLDQVRREVLRAAGLSGTRQSQVRVVVLGDEKCIPTAPAAEMKQMQSIRIGDDQEQLATLTLYGGNDQRLSEGMRHALNVAADRFLIIARYLKKFNEMEEFKGDFVSMLVHDLRSPLTSIRGFTDVLAEGMLGSVNDEQGAALKNIQGGCDRMLLLIADILDLAKIEAGKMQIHPAPLELRPLVVRICADLAPRLQESELTVELDIPEETSWVLADGKQLTRVLTNLLTNAVKFTPAGGHILVATQQPATCPAPHPGDCLIVSVTDTGPGIPPEQQQKLFGRYQQLPSGSLFRSGTGLGLAICTELVTLHHGEIWVESPVDEHGGTRFCFTLPLAE
jgi:signal transduction histidine kinase